MPPVIDNEKCIKCGYCADVCPVDVYYGSDESKMPNVPYGEDCFFCGACILECPTDAITLRYPLYAQPSYLPDKRRAKGGTPQRFGWMTCPK